MSPKINKINLIDNYPELHNLINSQEYKDYDTIENDREVLLARMREILEQKRITKEELAKRMHTKVTSISRLLNGDRPNFSIKTIIQFCIATDTSLELGEN
jgi:predicted XRE-type DNA-binding protein